MKEKETEERRKAIDNVVLEMRDRVGLCDNQAVASIAKTIQWLDDTEITEEDSGDRAGDALQAMRVTRKRLVAMQKKVEADGPVAVASVLELQLVAAPALAQARWNDLLPRRPQRRFTAIPAHPQRR